MSFERFIYPSPDFQQMWDAPAFKLLLKVIGKPSHEEVNALKPALMEGDPLADAVADLLKTHSMAELQALISTALDEGIEQVENAPAPLIKLFEEVDTVPDWVEPDKLSLASEVIRRSGNEGGYTLRNFALMGGYQSSAINKPLVFTGALDSGAANRIAETNSFWIDISRENGLGRFSPGVKTAIRVRIMHAFLRVRIQRNPEWSNDKWGLPINQADMLVTNLAFSALFLGGVRLLGKFISKKESEAVMHFWKYVGYLLGIKTDYLPNTEKEAQRLLYSLTIAQPGADEDSKILAKALMEEPLYAAFPKPKWQRYLRMKMHVGLSRYFLDKHTCEALDIPATPWVLAGNAFFAKNAVGEVFRFLDPNGTAKAVKKGGDIQEMWRQHLLDGKKAAYMPVKKLRQGE
jgi:hypothetical protein